MSGPRRIVLILLTIGILLPVGHAPAQSESGSGTIEVELFMLIGRSMVWMGNTVGYTVYETTRVEARINGITGETISIFRLGEQTPGRYLLPWDGTYHGQTAFAGRYDFELFFGEEYAVKFVFLARPVT
jgi:hypothetical protein